jgi:cysteine synthase B
MTALALEDVREDGRRPAPADRERPLEVVELIGNTPLLDLSTLIRRGAGSDAVRLYAKAEYANPGGSVKDRPALSMILDAERRGLLVPGGARRLLDATSGNTGIAYAMIGAAQGIPVTLCQPDRASPERKRILRAYGAELRLTDPLAGSDGAIAEARRLSAEDPERWAYLDQYSNPENWRAHYRTTGPEIWSQTAGAVTHFVTGLGTSGTLMGVGRFLRETSPGVRLISVEPDSPFHGLEGMKHMASALVPPIYDPSLADEAREIATERAYAMVKRLAREQGLLVGVSSGANVAAALEVASGLHHGTVATVLCDNADKYLSERFWEEPHA